jgi:glutathione S-transferase
MIKLYGSGISYNVNKVRYCLNYLNLGYDWEQTNPMQGENQTVEYLNICPTGKIPSIEIDGFMLFESNAINRYLARKSMSSIFPLDEKSQATMDAWMDYVSIHMAQAVNRVMFNRLMAPIVGEKVDQESLKVGLKFLEKYFPVIEKQLSKNKFLAGNEFTLADINLLAVLDPCELIQVSLARFPNITKWRNALKTQSFYQKCFKDYTLFAQEVMSAKAA